MKYEELKALPPEDFRRFCGVKPETFAAMLLTLQEDYQKKHRRGGREASISLEDKLLITMTYYREYRTQFHIATEFGTTESNVCKIVRQLEDVLVRHSQFALPGKKSLLQPSEGRIYNPSATAPKKDAHKRYCKKRQNLAGDHK